MMRRMIVAGMGMIGLAFTAMADDAGTATKAAGVAELTQKVDQAVAADGKWYCYHVVKTANRLKVVGQDAYVTPQEGDFFKIAKIGDRNYAVDAQKQYLEDNWQTAPDWQSRFIEHSQYYSTAQKMVEDVKKKVQSLKDQITDNTKKLNDVKNKLSATNKSISDLNAKIHSTKNNAGLKKQLESAESQRQAQQKSIHDLDQKDNDLKKLLKKQQDSQKTQEAALQKISKNPDGIAPSMIQAGKA